MNYLKEGVYFPKCLKGDEAKLRLGLIVFFSFICLFLLLPKVSIATSGPEPIYLAFSLHEGEFIPSQAMVLLTVNNLTKTIPLTELREYNENISFMNASYFILGKNLTGSGEGFGFLGKDDLYPKVYFNLTFSRPSADNSTPADGGKGVYIPVDNTSDTSTSSTPSNQNTLDTSTPTETSPITSPPSNPTSTDQPSNDLTFSASETLQAEQPQKESPSVPPITEGLALPFYSFVLAQPRFTMISSLAYPLFKDKIIKAALSILQSSMFVLASAQEASQFTIKTLSGFVDITTRASYPIDGQNISLVPNSVHTDAQLLNESDLSLQVTGNSFIVSTTYNVSTFGFGQDYLGNERRLILPFNPEEFSLQPGQAYEASILLVSDNLTLKEAYSTIFIPGNQNASNNTKGIAEPSNLSNEEGNLTSFQIPDFSFASGENYTLNLSDYLTDNTSSPLFIAHGSEHIHIDLEGTIATFSAAPEFTGVDQVSFTAIQNGINLLSNNITIEVGALINFTLVLQDKNGNYVDANLTLVDDNNRSIPEIDDQPSAQVTRTMRGVMSTTPASPQKTYALFSTTKATLSVDFSEKDSHLTHITFYNLTQKNTTQVVLGIDLPNITLDDYATTQTYAIDPTNLNFSSALVEAVAKGNALYKCRTWNFSAGICEGDWDFVMELSPGERYAFTLTPEDPGFLEQLQPSMNDTYVLQNNAGTNYGTGTTLIVRARTNQAGHAYLFFNTTGIPANAQVIYANLSLFQTVASTANRTLLINRVSNSSWTETGLTWTTQPANASYTDVINAQAAIGWVTFDVTKDILNFLNGTYPNYGWEIQDAVESGTTTIYTHTFASKENTNTSAVPELNIYFVIPSLIQFTDPTPFDEASSNNKSFIANISINETGLTQLIWNWNGTNYSVFDPSVMLLMPFNNVSALKENTTFVDDLATNNSGTLYNGTAPLTNGRYGSALSFDGANDIMYVRGSSNLNISGNLSFGLWLNPNANQPLDTILENSLVAGAGYRMWMLNSSVIGCTINTTTAFYSINTSIPRGSWSQIFCTYNDTGLGIYSNGALAGAVSAGGRIRGGSSLLYVGASGKVAGRNYTGYLDDLIIYNRSLPQRDIALRYVSTLYQTASNSSWQLEINQSYDDSSQTTKTYYACALERYGSTNCTEVRNITFTSYTPPTINLLAPLNTTTINDSDQVNFSFVASDTINASFSCSIYLDNVLNFTNSTTLNGTTTNFSIDSITYGTHNWSVTCFNGVLSNSSEFRTFTRKDTLPPTADPLFPDNNTLRTPANVSFNCNATDNLGLSNISLFINNNLNQTRAVSGITNTSTFGVLLSNGRYLWSCRAQDLMSNSNYSVNYTLTINSSAIPDSSKFGGRTTNWSNVSDLHNVCDGLAVVENVTGGMIQWNDCVDVAYQNLTSFIKISTNLTSVEVSLNPTFNSSANIALYNLTGWDATPDILMNDQICDSADCLNPIYDINSGSLTFSVTHFTNYSATGSARLTIWDQNDSSITGGGRMACSGNPERFYANYTRNSNGTTITGATCVVNFTDSTGNAMAYNATSAYYEFNRTFNVTGVRTYNIRCTRAGLTTITLNDFINVTDCYPPQVQFAPPTENSSTFLNRNILRINVTATDSNLARITIYLYNSSQSLINTTSSGSSPFLFNFTGLADGLYFFNASANDTSRFTNNTETRNVTIDTLTPSINFTTPTDLSGSTINRSYILANISANDTNLANISIFLYNASRALVNTTNSSSSPLYVNLTNLADGLYFFNATACDIVNHCNITETRNTTVAVPPLVALISPADNYYNSSLGVNITFVANISDNGNLANCSLWLNASGTWLKNQTVNLTGFQNTTNFTVRNIGYTSFLWNVQCFDYARNVGWGSANRTVILAFQDTTPPLVPLVSVEMTLYGINSSAFIYAVVNDSSPIASVQGNVTLPDSSMQIFNLSYNPILLRYEGYFSKTSLLGMYNVTILAKDYAGNLNNTQTTTFQVVQPNLTASKEDFPDPVQIGTFLNYTINTSAIILPGIVPLAFNDLHTIVSNAYFKDAPRIIKTKAGTLIIPYNQNTLKTVDNGNQDLYVVRSTNAGVNWSSPIQATNEVGHDAFPYAFEDKNGSLFIVYTHMDSNGSIWADGDVWLIQSFDDGLTWSEPYALTYTPGFTERQPLMLQDDSGMYYIAYEAGDGELYIQNSTSPLGGFSSRVQLTNNSYGDVDISADFKEGMFYFAWSPFDPVNNTLQNIFFANTTNPLVFNALDNNRKGITNNVFRTYESSITHDAAGNLYIGWSSTTNVSDNNWAYDSQINATSRELFMAVSYNNGITWDIKRLTTNNRSDGYPSIVQGGKDGVYYITAMIADPANGNMAVAFGQRDYAPSDAINVTIADTLPAGVDIINLSEGGSIQGNTVRWVYPVIYSGQTNAFKITVRINESLSNSTSITNFANISYFDSLSRLIGTYYLNASTTIIDTLAPLVQIIAPTSGTLINQSLPYTIQINVTDNALVNKVIMNLTYPNGSIQTIPLTYNAITRFYEFTGLNTSILGGFNITIFANDTTGNRNTTSSSWFYIINSPPTIPTNITCNGGSCSGYFNTTLSLNCSGSTDADNNTLTYHVEAFFAPQRGNSTLINASFETGNQSFTFYPNLYGTSATPQAIGRRTINESCVSGYCLGTELNVNTPLTNTSISGGWNVSLNVTDSPTSVEVSFHYRLRISDSTEPYENVTLMLKNITDGTVIAGPALLGAWGNQYVDQYLQGNATYRMVPTYGGNYSFDIGCKLSPVDSTSDYGGCWIDDVQVKAVNTSYTAKQWQEIGIHWANSTLLWNIFNEQPQTGVDFRCRAIDSGSLTYTPYFNLNANGTIIVDVKPPVITFLSPTPDSGSIVYTPYIPINTMAVDNGVVSNITIYVYNASGALINVSSANGGYYYLNRTGLVNGTYFFNASSCDTSGNCNNTEKRNITLAIDIIPPSLTLISPANNSIDGDGFVTLSYSASDNKNITRIELYINGAVVQGVSLLSPSVNASFNYTLGNGTYTWRVRTYDVGGNFNDSETRVIRYIIESLPLTDPTLFNGNTTNWSSLPDLTRVCNGTAILETDYDKVIWPGCVNVTYQSFDAYTNLTYNNVTVTFGVDMSFNSTATIFIKNLPWTETPDVYMNGVICNTSICTNVSYSNLTGIASFTVTHFTSYTTGSKSRLTIWDETDSGVFRGGQTKFPGQPVTFFANYTRISNNNFISGSICIINFSDSKGNVMIENTTVNLYQYTRSFISNGTFNWTVNCAKSGSDTLTTMDSVLINGSASDTLAPTIVFANPTDNSSSSTNSSILINVSALDGQSGVRNVTLYVYNASGSLLNFTNVSTNYLFLSFNPPAQGVYYFNASSCDVSNNCAWTETRNVTLDYIAPNVTIISAVSGGGGGGGGGGSGPKTEYSNTLTNNFTVNLSDDRSGIRNATIFIYDNATGALINMTTVTFVPKVLNTILGIVVQLVEGVYKWFYQAFDFAGNRAVSGWNDTLIIDTTPPIVNALIPNASLTNTTSYPLLQQFSCNATDSIGLRNLSLYLTNSQNQSFSLVQTTDVNGTSSVTVNWTVQLYTGNYTWNCLAYDLSGNYNWSGGNRSIQVAFDSSLLYQVFYGNSTAMKLLGNSSILFNFGTDPVKNIYFVNKDRSISWASLQAIGRTKSNGNASNDFNEVDQVLNLSIYPGNVNDSYSIDGSTPRTSATYNIYGTPLQYVPTIKSTNSTAFKTGMLWDTTQDLGTGEFSTAVNEDLVFVAAINSSQQGAFGSYDYEIKVPIALENYKGSSHLLNIYYEI